MPMDSVYTTTITREAQRRGIGVKVLDPHQPIFELSYRREKIRCYNALTDRVGAATYFLAQNKAAAHAYLAGRGYSVPAQEIFTTIETARSFLRRYHSVVVKPATQWGGRGVSVAVTRPEELTKALTMARKYEDEVLLEQCVTGIDYRLIYVNGRYVAAIRRDPAEVLGNGRNSLRSLIRSWNLIARQEDPSHRIPLDRETERTLLSQGLSYASVPSRGRRIRVRRTSNYHTGGRVAMATGDVPLSLRRIARRLVRELGIPVLGIDFLYDPRRRKGWIIELSPDLAISPPEGDIVVRHFVDFLFPETVSAEKRA